MTGSLVIRGVPVGIVLMCIWIITLGWARDTLCEV